MATVSVLHTSALDPPTRAAARGLLTAAFAGDFDEQDWEHCLGGMHALAWEDGRLVAHAAVVQRRLLHRGRALRTGYLEGVGVHPRHRGRGHGAAVMEAVEELIRAAYEIGALSATESALDFYVRRGWWRWHGPTSVLGPAGMVRTPEDDGSVHVLPITAGVDTAGELTCDWREGAAW